MLAVAEGWDTGTPSGRVAAEILVDIAHFEDRHISERTRSALATRNASGRVVGQPRRVPAEVVAKIQKLRAEGHNLSEIARLEMVTLPPGVSGRGGASQQIGYLYLQNGSAIQFLTPGRQTCAVGPRDKQEAHHDP